MSPRRVNQTIEAMVPELDDLRALFPHYVAYAEGEGKPIFEALSTPLAFELAKGATLTGLPAAAGVIDLCERGLTRRNRHWHWTSFSKQYLGGVVRVLMKVNGFNPTRRKRSIRHSHFTRGEVYAAA